MDGTLQHCKAVGAFTRVVDVTQTKHLEGAPCLRATH
jgi:hypothetical protein